MANRPLLLSTSLTVLILGLLNPNLAIFNHHSPNSSAKNLRPASEHRRKDMINLQKGVLSDNNGSAESNTDGGRLNAITSSTSSTKFTDGNRSSEINGLIHNNRTGLTSHNLTDNGTDGSRGNFVASFTDLTKVTDGNGSGDAKKSHEQEQNASPRVTVAA